MDEYILGITGASGSIYARRTLDALLDAGFRIRVIATEYGARVWNYELRVPLSEWCARRPDSLILEDNQNMFSPAASGSHPYRGMAIVPCSMSSLAQIANGITPNLLTRAADVTLKQKRPLVIVPRETPLSPVHLANMLALSQTGAFLVPAMPGFYGHPSTLDDLASFMAGKVLDCFQLDNRLYPHWEGANIP